MQKEYSLFNDVELVTNIRSNDHVLFVGTAWYPEIRKRIESSVDAVSVEDLDELIRAGRVFDKIFITNDATLDEVLVKKAIKLNESGMICFFSESEPTRKKFVDMIKSDFTPADVWPLESNIGSVVMTNVKGVPKWMD